MSYENGWAAINLEKPDVIPRTEYSAQEHWELVNRVLGTSVDANTSAEEKQAASSSFVKAWDYGMYWNVCLGEDPFGNMKTRMGHAEYAGGGNDYSSEVFCPFDDVEDVYAFDPVAAYGNPPHKDVVSFFAENLQKQKILYPDTVTMTGVYVTCMSGLINIFGWEMLLMAAGCDPDAFGAVADRYTKWITPYFEALAQCGAKVVMVHDDIVWTEGPFIHADWYRRYIFPNYKKLFAPLLEAGVKILYTSDGNYTEFLGDVADCRVNGFVLEPLTDLKAVADGFGQTHAIIGNADTRILLMGSREEIYGEVKHCMDIGKDCPGFIMAVGNHIPANTPVENALYYNECYEKLRKR